MARLDIALRLAPGDEYFMELPAFAAELFERLPLKK